MTPSRNPDRVSIRKPTHDDEMMHCPPVSQRVSVKTQGPHFERKSLFLRLVCQLSVFVVSHRSMFVVYIFMCHPHLTSINCCTAVWAQACGLERKTSFVIIVHRWFIRRHRSFFCCCWCVGGSNITILPLLVQIIRTFDNRDNSLFSVCW